MRDVTTAEFINVFTTVCTDELNVLVDGVSVRGDIFRKYSNILNQGEVRTSNSGYSLFVVFGTLKGTIISMQFNDVLWNWLWCDLFKDGYPLDNLLRAILTVTTKNRFQSVIFAFYKKIVRRAALSTVPHTTVI